MNYRSHTRSKITKALKAGLEVWALDTGNDGEDDVLIGTWEEVEGDTLSHHELIELPDHWTLTKWDWGVPN